MSGAVSVARSVTITLPIVPDRRLAPNRSQGKSRWTLGKLIDESRAAAFNAAYAQAGSRWDSGQNHERFDGPVVIEATIYWGKSLKAGQKRARIEQDRRLDWDSAVAICKPIFDGALVDMGYVQDDRQILGGPVWQQVDPSGDGYKTITITEMRP
jgi:hypothetical protein